jgi:hypothetical protein
MHPMCVAFSIFEVDTLPYIYNIRLSCPLFASLLPSNNEIPRQVPYKLNRNFTRRKNPK